MPATRRLLLQAAAASPALLLGCAESDPLDEAIERIRPLSRRMDPLRPGDWLESHREPGQTYREYRTAINKRAIDSYKSIRVVPIGLLSEGQQAVLDITVEFMRPFFGLPLELDAPVALQTVPADAQRRRFLAAGTKGGVGLRCGHRHAIGQPGTERNGRPTECIICWVGPRHLGYTSGPRISSFSRDSWWTFQRAFSEAWRWPAWRL